MKIYKALKGTMLGQGFECHKWMEGFYEGLGMKKGLHGGYDWGATNGQVIWYDCDVPGYVLNTETDSCGGLGINIITQDASGIFKHRYWHLKSFLVKAGDKVEMGDAIGLADNTGLSTGTHLHRDMKEMEKNTYGSLSIKNRNNGTFGTIEYKTEKEFVLDVLPRGESIRKQALMLFNVLMKRLKVA